ncbi:Arm DNA-binding domain-containing protein [Rhizobacter sp. Root1221]|uniref:Arm DNA-binding domain-containing protein n=1 Tax=Rhizobacter sp. Root1221 TaxID=1736433 RepID=UPI000A6BB908
MFDARAAKALGEGEHLTVDGAPGLRLVATASTRTWKYRYKSPVEGLMRQIKLGRWPAMGLPAALAAWEKVKAQRDVGGDPAAAKRAVSTAAKVGQYIVSRACADFLEANRSNVAPRTYAEAERTLNLDTTAIAARAAASITRADAFDLIDAKRGHPVQARRLRQLLGAVWDRALDAGRPAPDVPNWWRLVLRGKLKSKGKKVKGEHFGVAKRVLNEPELALLIPWLSNFSRDAADALTLYCGPAAAARKSL